MSNVIGFKGTADERLLNWSFLLFLRKHCVASEKELYKETFENYRKAA